ncbi:polymer-forming cytoskeletal protein [Paenibacillus sp. HW567]|uniref:polymer-forming cytoskeletal protein n=1 Tax=Paenibacillus sp. HW567 TaxID=1034769 RepID=UPI00036B0BEC|nr:polymer-forming cytoskeletal protein [Paenibacillus sp. HW567]
MNETAARRNLKILGNSTMSGGSFLDVKVVGECEFHGDVDCGKLKLTGEAWVHGNLRMEKVKLTGECTVKGSIDGESLSGQGEVRAGSDLHIEEIKLAGSLSVAGDCEAEEIRVTGALQVEGVLNAENVELSLYGPSHAAEARAGSIAIKRKIGAALMHPGRPTFTAGLIEGDEVDLQGTQAGIVRGNRVIIGTDCNIDRVEYRESLEIHEKANVNYRIKL